MASLGSPPADLRGFPRRSLRGSVEMHRVHPAGLGPWWFSSDGNSRFDLVPPAGTCYLSLSAVGAFVEVFRDFTFVDAVDVRTRVISGVRAPRDVVLADCTSTRARGYGVTAAVHSTPDYVSTQAWAGALRLRGFDGVRYYCGHDPSQRHLGIALFGDAGAAAFPLADTLPIGDDVLRTVERGFGIHVLPAP